MKKSPFVAFWLSFIPGAGHAYLRRPVRAIVYSGAFFGSLLMFLLVMLASSGNAEELGILLLIAAALAGCINMIDMVFTLISGKTPALTGAQRGWAAAVDSEMQQGAAYGPDYAYARQQEKTKTILMSFIPGLGHMNLGLMQRGITFLLSFVGLFAIIVFISSIMRSGTILIFLLALPVIWIYGMFDAISLVHTKQRGEELRDKSLFEGIEEQIATGRKNKVLAIVLAIFPGAGHLYLGLQKRGLQLMAGFLFAIYIMDNMRLSLFLFLLPLFWCFAFFDALGQTSRYERQKMNDEALYPAFQPYQRWLGIGLIGFGVYFMLDQIVISMLAHFWPKIQGYYNHYKYMLPTAIIAFVMIVIGLKLAFGDKSLIGGGSADKSVGQGEEEGGRR